MDRVSSHEPRMLPWIGVFTMGVVFRVFRLVAGWWLVAGRSTGCVILYWLGISYIQIDIGYSEIPISYIPYTGLGSVLYPISYIQTDIGYRHQNPISYILYPGSRGSPDPISYILYPNRYREIAKSYILYPRSYIRYPKGSKGAIKRLDSKSA